MQLPGVAPHPYRDVLAFIDGVNSPAVKACIDVTVWVLGAMSASGWRARPNAFNIFAIAIAGAMGRLADASFSPMKPFATLRLFLLLLIVVGPSLATARTLRLFTVGNSFSENATRYLPQLAKEGGHELILGKAVKGGCSFQQHWDAVEAWRANPEDPAAKIYSGKSLHERLGAEPWDVITVQQYSLHSSDLTTYRPYAPKLVAHLKSLRPGAEIVLHQTWAYRVDADRFGLVAPQRHAASQGEMYEHSRAAYWAIATELRLRVIPTGDALWRVDSDPVWGFQRDVAFDPKTAVHPALPKEVHSLHVGYRWNSQKKLAKDANHANAAGEYLGALVWYGFLFDESPAKLTFVPAGVDADFAAHLRTVAWKIVQENAPANAKVARAR